VGRRGGLGSIRILCGERHLDEEVPKRSSLVMGSDEWELVPDCRILSVSSRCRYRSVATAVSANRLRIDERREN
jgi:hypothetical protein